MLTCDVQTRSHLDWAWPAYLLKDSLGQNAPLNSDAMNIIKA